MDVLVKSPPDAVVIGSAFAGVLCNIDGMAPLPYMAPPPVPAFDVVLVGAFSGKVLDPPGSTDVEGLVVEDTEPGGEVEGVAEVRVEDAPGSNIEVTVAAYATQSKDILITN
ncbi:hypothetical protein ONZ51_g11179 [Trametes cubensis]|uniref:Uncharacterized protein n=1 Tax=Trametes cubensis TaxID=1111947 RepID=A0AAD7TI45_9APHY|nr:hypothetical protein ONZ51_g11179 [Trametes cubensis]